MSCDPKKFLHVLAHKQQWTKRWIWSEAVQHQIYRQVPSTLQESIPISYHHQFQECCQLSALLICPMGLFPRLDFRRSLVSGLPSPRRTAGRGSSKLCLWHRFLIKILAAFLAVRNAILMAVTDGLTWRLQLVTFVAVPFSLPFLLILAFQPILFHTVVKRSFSKKK